MISGDKTIRLVTLTALAKKDGASTGVSGSKRVDVYPAKVLSQFKRNSEKHPANITFDVANAETEATFEVITNDQYGKDIPITELPKGTEWFVTQKDSTGETDVTDKFEIFLNKAHEVTIKQKNGKTVEEGNYRLYIKLKGKEEVVGKGSNITVIVTDRNTSTTNFPGCYTKFENGDSKQMPMSKGNRATAFIGTTGKTTLHMTTILKCVTSEENPATVNWTVEGKDGAEGITRFKNSQDIVQTNRSENELELELELELEVKVGETGTLVVTVTYTYTPTDGEGHFLTGTTETSTVVLTITLKENTEKAIREEPVEKGTEKKTVEKESTQKEMHGDNYKLKVLF